jgi:hypothetical protein
MWINSGCHYSKQTPFYFLALYQVPESHTTQKSGSPYKIYHRRNTITVEQPLYEISPLNIVFLICKPIFAYTKSLLSKTIICSWCILSAVLSSKIMSNVQKAATSLRAQNQQHRSCLLVAAVLLWNLMLLLLIVLYGLNKKEYLPLMLTIRKR